MERKMVENLKNAKTLLLQSVLEELQWVVLLQKYEINL